MKLYLMIAIAAVMTLTGCQKTLIVPDAMAARATQCQLKVSETEKTKAENEERVLVTSFKDESNMLVAMALEKLGDAAAKNTVSPFAVCGNEIIAWLEQNGAIKRSNNALVGKVISGTVVLAGIKITGDVVEGVIGSIAGSGASTVTQLENVSITNNGGAGGGEGSHGGAATMNTVIGSGNKTNVLDNSQLIRGKVQQPGGDLSDDDGNNNSYEDNDDFI